MHALLTVWLLAALLAWILFGWNVDNIPAPGSLLPEFPWGAIRGVAAAGAIAAILTLTGSYFVGHLSPRRRAPGVALAFSFLAGGAMAGIVCGLVAFGWLGPGLVILPLVLVVAWRRGRPRLDLNFTCHLPQVETVLAVLFALFEAAAAMAPAVESDGLRYHLVGPQEWLRAGRFVNLPYNANSNLPALSGLLVAAGTGGLELGRVFQLMQFAHLVALLVLGGEVARTTLRTLRSRRGGDGGGGDETLIPSIARLVILGVPVIALVASWPFSDVASACYLVAGVWAVMPGHLRSLRGRLVFGSLFLGACVAAKISNLPLAGLVGLWALVANGPSLACRPALVAALVLPGLLVLAPWLVKNTIHHGNPVYPLAYRVLGGPEWSPANESFYRAKMHEKGMGRDAVAFLLSPWNVTVSTNTPAFEQQNPGPGLLALLPAALLGGLAGLARPRRFASSPAALMLLLIGGGWVTWFVTYQSVRFLIPEIICVVLLGSAFLFHVATRMSRELGGISARVTLLVLGLAGAAWNPVYHLIADHVYRPAFGIVGEEVAIAKRFAAYPVIRWLEQNTDRNEPVFYIGEHRAAYARHYKPLASDWYDTPLVLVEIRRTADNAELLREWHARGIRYVLMNLAELSLYERAYFQPRFTPSEWARFESLRRELLGRVVLDSGDGVFVCAVDGG